MININENLLKLIHPIFSGSIVKRGHNMSDKWIAENPERSEHYMLCIEVKVLTGQNASDGTILSSKQFELSNFASLDEINDEGRIHLTPEMKDMMTCDLYKFGTISEDMLLASLKPGTIKIDEESKLIFINLVGEQIEIASDVRDEKFLYIGKREMSVPQFHGPFARRLGVPGCRRIPGPRVGVLV